MLAGFLQRLLLALPDTVLSSSTIFALTCSLSWVFVRQIGSLLYNHCTVFLTFFALPSKSILKNYSVLKVVPILSTYFFSVCLDICTCRKCLSPCSPISQLVRYELRGIVQCEIRMCMFSQKRTQNTM